MADLDTFEPGTVIDDSVEILAVVGRGATGSVYKAKQPAVDRAVAVKALHPAMLSDRDSIARFFREAKLVSSLDHPNIVRIYKVGMATEVQPYFVMDYIEGGTFAELIAANKITADNFVDIFIQIADALAHAHSKGVVHRDIKPRNILMIPTTGGYAVKVVDFGIARSVQAVTIEGQKITKTGAIIGSPIYMSPEQCTGRPVDHRSDIYSLGCVMYEALTGQPPFYDQDAVSLIGKHVFETPPPAQKICRVPGVPAEIFDVVAITLQKEPDLRYQSVEHLRDDLRSIKVHDQPVVAQSLTSTIKVARPQQNPLNRVVALAIVASIFAAAGWFISRSYALRADHSDATVSEANEICQQAFMLRTHKHRYSEACKLYQRAYDLFKTTHVRDKQYADVCAGLAHCEFALGDFEAANHHYAEALTIRREVDPANELAITDLHRDFGRCYLAQEKYRDAAEQLLVAYRSYCKLPVTHKIPLQKDLIDALLRTHQYQTALMVFPGLIDAEKEFGIDPAAQAETISLYSRVLRKTGQTEEAVRQKQLARELEDLATRGDESSSQ